MKICYLGLAAAGLMVGCGSAKADLYLYDAAPAGVTGVTVQVKSVDVHVDSETNSTDSVAADDTSIDQDGKWQSLAVGTDGQGEAIDLMQHQGVSAADFLGTLTVPSGKITQLRMVLDLSDASKNFVTFDSGSTCELDTTAVAQTGVKVNHVFKVVSEGSGDTAEIYLHFDLDNSLVASSTCFKLTPVIDVGKIVKNGKAQQI